MKQQPILEPLAAHQLPGLSQALTEIPVLARSTDSYGLGVISFDIRPDAAFLRLSPESSLRLYHQITRRLREQLRETDHLYNLNHWKWLIVIPGLRSSATLTMAMLKLRHLFDESGLSVDGIAMHLKVFCGAAIHPDDGEDALHLVQSAQIASLNAEYSDSGMAFYTPEMEELDARLINFDQELRAAFSGDNGLQLYLQPQFDAVSRRCVGAECLLRWKSVQGIAISPPELLAAIERLGLRHRFNRWLFLTAARLGRQLVEAGIEIGLSINLSANDLLDPEVPDLLEQALMTWNVAPASIRLEITETSMVQETGGVIDVLVRLRQIGASLSIDDFGTGFSGMSNLKKLPVQEIKIDQSFIFHLTESQRDREITKSIIQLSHRLDLQVVAEGVEDQATAELLTEMGCDWLQGYLFSPALPLESFIVWHQQWQGRRTS